MSKFGTKGVKETTFESKYIEPGIHENIKIAEIKGVQNEGKSPYVEIKFENPDGKTADVKFFMSEKAQERSFQKIKHIATKVTTEEALDAIEADSIESYGAKLNQLLAGKVLRMKFTGEEVEGKFDEEKQKKNQNWFKATVGLPPFAEKMEISSDKSKLKFDPNNEYDVKRLEKADGDPSTDASGTEEKPKGDLPF